eukprot:5780198-Amphidinium_carterae.2
MRINGRQRDFNLNSHSVSGLRRHVTLTADGTIKATGVERLVESQNTIRFNNSLVYNCSIERYATRVRENTKHTREEVMPQPTKHIPSSRTTNNSTTLSKTKSLPVPQGLQAASSSPGFDHPRVSLHGKQQNSKAKSAF